MGGLSRCGTGREDNSAGSNGHLLGRKTGAAIRAHGVVLLSAIFEGHQNVVVLVHEKHVFVAPLPNGDIHWGAPG